MNDDKIYDVRSRARGSTTIIEPTGDLTPALSHDLHETVRRVTQQGRNVEISLRRISHVSWAGLWELAASLGQGRLGHVRFRGVVPRVRSLMNEVGFDPHRIVD